MAKMYITTTTFVKPNPISQLEYDAIKSVLKRNPNDAIVEPSESFIEHFSGYFTIMGLGLLVVIIIGCVAESGSPLIGLAVIVGIFAFIAAMQVFISDGPSYATYLRDEKRYYAALKSAITSSSSYYDFTNKFYGK